MYDVPNIVRVCAMIASASVLSASDAKAAGDAANGAVIFQQCGACHSRESGKIIVGPSLYGVIGRQAGAMPDYPYSPAMQDAAKKGLTWTPENVVSYLENPRKFLNDFAGSNTPNKMTFSLADVQAREDVVAYLQAPK